MSDVLFELTKDHLETGLRGVPVGYCTTSTVDPQKGLHYIGKPINTLAFRDPENVMFLLYYGREPAHDELEAFKKELERRSCCRGEILKQISLLPRKGHPMKLFSIAILLAGLIGGVGDYKEDCLNLMAKIPVLTAAVINHHAGWGGINGSNPELGYMENFVQMLNVPGADNEGLTKIMRVFDILHFDHGGGNLSTFVGKAVASGLEDLYGSIAAAMCALAGPRHGKANQDSLEFVAGALKELGEFASDEQVEAFIRQQLAENKLVYGFGHAVLRVEDSRAAVLYDIAANEYDSDPLVKTALLLRKVAPKILGENPKIADPYPNVDAISGPLLAAAGFNYPEYFTVLFGMARTVGIAIQIVYERCEARDGKGTPIIRPKYIYKSREQT